MRRRPLRIALVIVAGALLAVFVGAFVRFDPVRFVEAAEARRRQDAVRGVRPPRPSEAQLSRWHRGDGPCFTYAPPEVAPERVAAIADELQRAGLAEAPDATLLLADWSVGDERRRHGAASSEEIAALFADGPWHERWLGALHRGQIERVVRQRVRTSESQVRARAERRQATLGPENSQRLRAIWQRHRLELSVPTLLAVRRTLPP